MGLCNHLKPFLKAIWRISKCISVGLSYCKWMHNCQLPHLPLLIGHCCMSIMLLWMLMTKNGWTCSRSKARWYKGRWDYFLEVAQKGNQKVGLRESPGRGQRKLGLSGLDESSLEMCEDVPSIRTQTRDSELRMGSALQTHRCLWGCRVCTFKKRHNRRILGEEWSNESTLKVGFEFFMRILRMGLFLWAGVVRRCGGRVECVLLALNSVLQEN